MLKHFKKVTKGHWPIFFYGNLGSLANLLLPILLVRLLSPAEIGLYKTFFLYLAVLPFLSLAGGAVNSVYYWVGHEEGIRKEYIKSSWLVTLALSSFTFIIGLGIYFFFQDRIPFSATYFSILLITGFLVCPSGHYAEVCLAKGKISTGALLSLSFELIKVGGFIYLAWANRSVGSIFYFFLLMMIFSFCFMTYLGWKNSAITFRVNPVVIKNILRYSLPISVSSGLFYMMDKADLLIFSSLLAPNDFAFYSLGCLVIPPLLVLEMSVQKILIPKLVTSYIKQDFKDMEKNFRNAISDIGYLVIPSFFGLFFFSEPIIELLYTNNFSQSSKYLQFFSFSYLLLLIPHDSILRATGHTNKILKIYILFLPLMFLVVFISTKYLSPQWTLALSIFIKFLPKLYCLYYSRLVIQTKMRALIPWRQLAIFTGLSVLLTVLSLSIANIFSSQLQWLLVVMPLFALIYLAVVAFLKTSGRLQRN